MKSLRLSRWFVIGGLALTLALPRPARASDPLVRSMLIGGAYGLVGGAIVGLATYPLNKTIRAMGIGASVGLYLGLAVGVFYWSSKYDPGNPLRPPQAENEAPETPAEYSLAKANSVFLDQRVPPPVARLSFELARF